jgi:hypothetical protein
MSTVNVSNNSASSVSGANAYQPASAPSENTTTEVEQLLQDIENLLQQASQSAGQTAGTQSTPQASTPQASTPQASTPQASTAQPTSGGMPTTGSTGSNAMDGQSASGALAAYMGTNGDQSLNMNDLYKLSQGEAAGGSGQTPSPEVQQAAQYMLANPGVYNKIETNDVAGADGISGATNFQNAAEGNIPGVTAGASQTAGTAQPTSGGMPTSGTPAASPDAQSVAAINAQLGASGMAPIAGAPTSGTPAAGSSVANDIATSRAVAETMGAMGNAMSSTPATGNSDESLTQEGADMEHSQAQQAMSAFKNVDPTDFANFETALEKGDASGAAAALAGGLQDGLDKQDGAGLESQITPETKANGGNGGIGSAQQSELNNAFNS